MPGSLQDPSTLRQMADLTACVDTLCIPDSTLEFKEVVCHHPVADPYASAECLAQSGERSLENLNGFAALLLRTKIKAGLRTADQ